MPDPGLRLRSSVAARGVPGHLAGSDHFWFAPLLQDQTTSCVPFVRLNAGSSRHRCRKTSTYEPPVCIHRWFEPPLQVNRMTLVPLWPNAWSSMHLPCTCNSPLEVKVKRCAAVPLQSQMSILLRSAVLLRKLSTHLPAKPVIWPPGGGGGGVEDDGDGDGDGDVIASS